MQATVLDMRYRMKDVLKALNNKSQSKIEDHPLFGMDKNSSKTPKEIVENIRNGRYKF